MGGGVVKVPPRALNVHKSETFQGIDLKLSDFEEEAQLLLGWPTHGPISILSTFTFVTLK